MTRKIAIAPESMTHHYLLVAVFFVFSLLTISFYGHLLRSLIKENWVYSVFFWGCYGLVFVFTHKLYSRFSLLFKYIFIAILMLLFGIPFLVKAYL